MDEVSSFCRSFLTNDGCESPVGFGGGSFEDLRHQRLPPQLLSALSLLLFLRHLLLLLTRLILPRLRLFLQHFLGLHNWQQQERQEQQQEQQGPQEPQEYLDLLQRNILFLCQDSDTQLCSQEVSQQISQLDHTSSVYLI